VDTAGQDQLVGRTLDGRYLVESRIARGGMATVYLAVDTRLEREVALKVMHPHLADDDSFVARFVREARSAARLSHPNVVQVFDQGADGDLLYLAMEHLPGRTLRGALTERGVLTPREALTVTESVLDALSAAHRAGIVHRDVKPENVILTDEGRVKVADFGLARAFTGGGTTTGALIGTVAYLSPELVSRGIADARSDVYAAGIMLFEMLTGRQPFVGDVPMQVAYQHVHEDVPPPSSLVPALPQILDDLVLHAVARDPDLRPADAGEWLTEVRQVRRSLSPELLDARPALPRPVSAPSGAAPWATSAPSGGSPTLHHRATEVVASGARAGAAGQGPGGYQPTQTLPELNGLRQLRDRGNREPGADGGGPDDRVDFAELDELARRRRRRGWWLAGIILLLAAALGTAAWWAVKGPGSQAEVPRLIGLSVPEANTRLAAVQLNGDAQPPEYSETVPKDQIDRTDPDAGQSQVKGGSVKYWVSLGTAVRTVPQVVGKTLPDAKAALAKANLAIGDTTQTVQSDTVPKGSVVTSQPAPGATVKANDPVALVVSSGPPPVDVPNVVNQDQQAAVDALAALGLKADTGQQEFSDQVPEGAVISQDPPEGKQLGKGQTVQLVISKGPELVQVPNVISLQFNKARSQLAALGFQVSRTDLAGGFFGTVRFQLPLPGQMVAKGSTVRLTVV